VSVIRVSNVKGQLVHNREVQAFEGEEIEADGFWSFVKKTEAVSLGRTQVEDCWITLSLAQSGGLI